MTLYHYLSLSRDPSNPRQIDRNHEANRERLSISATYDDARTHGMPYLCWVALRAAQSDNLEDVQLSSDGKLDRFLIVAIAERADSD